MIDPALRRKSIGASDAGDIVLGPQFPKWAEKTGIAEPPNLDAVEAVQWGNLLEEVIAKTYAERSSRHVAYNLHQKPITHPEYPFLTATLDATQLDKVKGPGALEIKNVGEYLARDWGEEPPLRVQIQLQHQLACKQLQWGTLCALIGGNKLRWFDMDRNDEFIAAMIEKESFFWTAVLDKVPPDPDGSIATADCLRMLYPQDSGEIIELPAEAVEWDRMLVAAKECVKEWEDAKRQAQNQLKAALGNATTGVLPNGDRYTWKSQTAHHEAREAYDSKFRVLRRKKG